MGAGVSALDIWDSALASLKSTKLRPEFELEEVPAPSVKSGNLLIETTRSLVSLGTERMLVEFGKSNIFGKIKQQPHRSQTGKRKGSKSGTQRQIA